MVAPKTIVLFLASVDAEPPEKTLDNDVVGTPRMETCGSSPAVEFGLSTIWSLTGASRSMASPQVTPKKLPHVRRLLRVEHQARRRSAAEIRLHILVISAETPVQCLHFSLIGLFTALLISRRQVISSERVMNMCWWNFPGYSQFIRFQAERLCMDSLCTAFWNSARHCHCTFTTDEFLRIPKHKMIA